MYIYQYSKLYDLRMTIEEREEIAMINKKSYLDIEKLIQNNKTIGLESIKVSTKVNKKKKREHSDFKEARRL